MPVPTRRTGRWIPSHSDSHFLMTWQNKFYFVSSKSSKVQNVIEVCWSSILLLTSQVLIHETPSFCLWNPHKMDPSIVALVNPPCSTGKNHDVHGFFRRCFRRTFSINQAAVIFFKCSAQPPCSFAGRAWTMFSARTRTVASVAAGCWSKA